jgi:hypothetical protein
LFVTAIIEPVDEMGNTPFIGPKRIPNDDRTDPACAEKAAIQS